MCTFKDDFEAYKRGVLRAIFRLVRFAYVDVSAFYAFFPFFFHLFALFPFFLGTLAYGHVHVPHQRDEF